MFTFHSRFTRWTSGQAPPPPHCIIQPTNVSRRSWSFSNTWLLQFIHLYLGPTSFGLEGATMMNQLGSNNDFDALCTQVWNLGELTPSGLGLLNWGQGAGGRRTVGGTTIIVIQAGSIWGAYSMEGAVLCVVNLCVPIFTWYLNYAVCATRVAWGTIFNWRWCWSWIVVCAK